MTILRLVLISDTHNVPLENLNLPEGDILLHSGDFTSRGTLQEFVNFDISCGKVADKYTHGIYVTPGNHDFFAQQNPNAAKNLLTHCHLLIDEAVRIKRINFWFSPWQPYFFNWAFNLPRNGEELDKVWKKIPKNTQILVTHSPAFGMLDKVPNGQQVGCERLKTRIEKLPKLIIHQFGHIHCDYGVNDYGKYIAVNASTCDERYSPGNDPIVLDLNTISKSVTYV